MNLLLKSCPTYARFCVWLWHSPTFTTWGNYGVQSLRLILVTPFILSRFDETEIAAWYLFASLNIFGTILTQRLGLTFSRMIAFAMGGASHLGPITGKREQENGGQPNWSVFERAYGTIGSINLGIGWLNVVIAFGMGWFGLSNLLEGYEAKAAVWLAFAIMQGTALIGFVFQHYQVALQGMNYVALVNRWNVIFGIASCIGGSLGLYLGGGLITLVVVMQLVLLLGIVRNWFLLRRVESGRVACFSGFRFDREVFGWAWGPAWKGFIGQFGMMGGVQLAGVIYTAYGSKMEVAALLFSIRMMQTLSQMAQAPFASVQPLMSRMMASGQIQDLKRLLRIRIGVSLGLTACGIILGGVSFPYLLNLIGSKLTFIDVDDWLIMGGFVLLLRFNVMSSAICGIGNHIVFYWDMLISVLFTVGLLFLAGNSLGVLGPICATYVPMLLILNIRPYRKSAEALGGVDWLIDFWLIFLSFVGLSAAIMIWL